MHREAEPRNRPTRPREGPGRRGIVALVPEEAGEPGAGANGSIPARGATEGGQAGRCCEIVTPNTKCNRLGFSGLTIKTVSQIITAGNIPVAFVPTASLVGTLYCVLP